MIKPRFLRLLVIACIAGASLGATLLISAGGAVESPLAPQVSERVAHHGK